MINDRDKIIVKIPMTYMWLLRKMAGKGHKTVLDLGCGEGRIMQIIKSNDWKITGIDIHRPTVKKAKDSGTYREVIYGDLVKQCEKLVKNKKKYDLVFCSQVIEHITKDEGNRILDLSEKLAKRRIYFGTPRGFMVQPEVFIGENPYQYHKSGWEIEEFKKRKYKVYGVGLNVSWSENGLARSSNRLLVVFANTISYLLSPLSYFIPQKAAGIMAIKDKK